ncbi:GerAB/ArcD/ProY family transporter [Paenibacillus guangzhouensis]|uniref:GerAB/ArcD/ProY family transporter n=1 Tax=Paenibacillus guangzhouensis TaxID=1473112 RepID=UPI00126750BA|nr:endospore germination permease [Paenibacillus guangzhouensis]
MQTKITKLQGILLMMSTIAPTAILSVPSVVVQLSGQDAWASIIIAMLVGILFSLLIGSICRQNTQTTFVEWLRERLGSKVGTLIGILLTYYYLISVVIEMREFVNFIGENVLSRTPVYFLLIITVVVVMFGVSKGIVNIAQINVIVMPLSIVVFIVTGILLMKDIHVENLLPVWDHPLSKVVHGSITPFTWLLQISILLLIAPFMNKPEEAGKVGIWGIVLTCIELGIIVIAAITIIGTKLISIMSYPTFYMIGIIQIGSFLERIDLLFISIWICMMYVKMSIVMFATFHCFVETFRIRNQQPFLIGFGLFTIFTTLYAWPKSVDLAYFSKTSLIPYAVTFNILVPLVVWLLLRFIQPNPMKAGK